MTTQTTTQTATQYANRLGWSDVEPFEVVKVISAKTMEIRSMNAEIDPEWKRDFQPGGFFGHTSNNSSQKWIITSDETQPVIRIRLGKKGWKDANGNRYQLADQPRKFYDYNF